MEERALIWLCACTAFEYKERAALLRAAGNPARLFKEDEKFFTSVIKRSQTGVYNKGQLDRERETDAFLKDCEKKNRFAVTVLDDDYPKSLKTISDPPFVLFGEGRRELLKARKFCIVGSRKIPSWAERTGKMIAAELSSRFAIVTGLAEGGDSAAIAGALDSGNLISVLPNGLDECYPASHGSLKRKIAQKGLLLTECAPHDRVKKYSFHARNRILAGLSEGVLILSAGERSGTLITANDALDYGRDVFALPHNPGVEQGAGCNALIKKGAYLVTETADIFACYGMDVTERKIPPLTKEEKTVLSVLRETGELHLMEIAERTGLKVDETTAVLTALEIKNLAVRSGGNRYAAI